MTEAEAIRLSGAVGIGAVLAALALPHPPWPVLGLLAMLGAVLLHGQWLLRSSAAGRAELQAQASELLEQQREALQHKLELEEKNRELHHLSAAKSEFLAAMSHELRTPLNAVLGFTELLTEGVAGEVNEGQREYLGDIHASGTHLLRLINDILDYSRLEAGKLELNAVTVDLERPVQEAVEMLRVLAQKKGVTLTARTEAGLEVLGDPLRLKQVALNLVANAVKFTPRGGAVTVLLEATAESLVRLSVCDTGIGISAEHQQAIFEAFHQVDGDAQRRFEGTGLGLALVKKLLGPMSGTVRVESTEGQGATFVVELPRQAAPRVRVPPLERFLGTDVLVAEDDAATRHLLSRVLETNGCKVRGAVNGQRALESLLEKLPEVLVLDLMMPELDGFAVLERLRALPRGWEVEVLVFSATEPTEDRRELILRYGAHVVVKGTVATTELVGLVAKLARHEARSAA